MEWEEIPATENVCALSVSGDFVISHRPQLYTVSYRPAGQHIPVGQFKTLGKAKDKAKEYKEVNVD